MLGEYYDNVDYLNLEKKIDYIYERDILNNIKKVLKQLLPLPTAAALDSSLPPIIYLITVTSNVRVSTSYSRPWTV